MSGRSLAVVALLLVILRNAVRCQDVQYIGGAGGNTQDSMFRSCFVTTADPTIGWFVSYSYGSVTSFNLTTLARVRNSQGCGSNAAIASFTDGRYAYVGTYDVPGRVAKFDLTTATVAVSAQAGHATDRQYTTGFALNATHGAFGALTTPGRMVIWDLTTVTRVSQVEAPADGGLDQFLCSVNDAQYAWFGTRTAIAAVVRFNLRTLQYDSFVFADTGEKQFQAATKAGSFGYFSGPNTPAIVVKFNLDTMVRVGAVPALGGEDNFLTAVNDGVYGYFGTGNGVTPGKVVQFDLNTMTRVAAATATTAENFYFCSLRDTTGHAYFGTSTSEGRVSKYRLRVTTAAPTTTAAATPALTTTAVATPALTAAVAATTVPTTTVTPAVPTPVPTTTLAAPTTTGAATGAATGGTTGTQTTITGGSTTTFASTLGNTSTPTSTVTTGVASTTTSVTGRATSTSSAATTTGVPTTTTPTGVPTTTTQAPPPPPPPNTTAPPVLGFDRAAQRGMVAAATSVGSVAALSGAPTSAMSMSRAIAVFELVGCPKQGAAGGPPGADPALSFPKSFFPGLTAGSVVGGHARMASVGFVLGSALAYLSAFGYALFENFQQASAAGCGAPLVRLLREHAPAPYTVGTYVAVVSGFWAQSTGVLAVVKGDGVFIDAVLLCAVPWAVMLALVALFCYRVRTQVDFVFDGDVDDALPKARSASADAGEAASLTPIRRPDAEAEPLEAAPLTNHRLGLAASDVYCAPNPELTWFYRLQLRVARLLRSRVGRYLITGDWCWKAVSPEAARFERDIRSLFTKCLGPPIHGATDRFVPLNDMVQRSRLRFKLAPFTFPILCGLSVIASLAHGIASADMAKSCKGALVVLVIVNVLAAAFSCVALPFCVPIRNVTGAFLDVVIAVSSLIALIASVAIEDAGSDAIKSVQLVTSMSVTVGGFTELALSVTRNICFLILRLRIVPLDLAEELRAADRAQFGDDCFRYEKAATSDESSRGGLQPPRKLGRRDDEELMPATQASQPSRKVVIDELEQLQRALSPRTSPRYEVRYDDDAGETPEPVCRRTPRGVSTHQPIPAVMFAQRRVDSLCSRLGVVEEIMVTSSQHAARRSSVIAASNFRRQQDLALASLLYHMCHELQFERMCQDL